MKTSVVYSSINLPDITLISGFLREHGINNQVINANSPSLEGAIPLGEATSKIIVSQADANLARELIREGLNREPIIGVEHPLPDSIPDVPFVPRPPSPYKYLSAFLLLTTLIAGYLCFRLFTNLQYYRDSTNFTYETDANGCMVARWMDSKRIAHLYCNPTKAHGFTYVRSYDRQDHLISEFYYREGEHFPYKSVGYTKDGKAEVTSYDDDMDGFYDRSETPAASHNFRY